MPEATETTQTQTTDVTTSNAPTADAAGADAAAPNPSPADEEAKADAKMREILAGLNGEPVEGKTDDAAPAAEPDKPEAEGEPEQAEPEAGPDDEKLQAARAALKRWQYPDEVIAGLPPDRLLELGEKAKAAQAEQDRTGNERARLKKLLAEIEAERTATPAEPAATTDDAATPDAKEKPAPAVQQDADFEQAFKALTEHPEAEVILGDMAEPLKRVFHAQQAAHNRQVEALKQQHEQAVASMDQTLNALALQLDAVLFDAAAQSLADEFPQLADPEKRALAEDRARQLANLKGYDSFTSPHERFKKLMRDAAGLEFGPQKTKDMQARLVERHQKQTRGTTTNPSPSAKPPKAMSPDERLELALKRLNAGDDPDVVNRELAAASAGDS